jgi:hypothetical protein
MQNHVTHTGSDQSSAASQPAHHHPSQASSSAAASPQRRASARMPREQALVLAGKWKKYVLASSILGFGALSGLAISHQVGATTSQGTGSPLSQTRAAHTEREEEDEGFFNQQGGGYGFGNGGSSQPPVSSSNVSPTR